MALDKLQMPLPIERTQFTPAQDLWLSLDQSYKREYIFQYRKKCLCDVNVLDSQFTDFFFQCRMLKICLTLSQMTNFTQFTPAQNLWLSLDQSYKREYIFQYRKKCLCDVNVLDSQFTDFFFQCRMLKICLTLSQMTNFTQFTPAQNLWLSLDQSYKREYIFQYRKKCLCDVNVLDSQFTDFFFQCRMLKICLTLSQMTNFTQFTPAQNLWLSLDQSYKREYIFQHKKNFCAMLMCLIHSLQIFFFFNVVC